MAFDQLLGTAAKLNASTEALAALAAYLRIDTEGLDAHPAVSSLLKGIVQALGGDELLGDVTPEQRKMASATIRAFFLQAAELVDNPARAPGWSYADAVVLQSQGQASSMWPMLVEKCLGRMSGLDAALAREGCAFLDVGTGVAKLAIAACQKWPKMRVVGVDPWEPSITLARRNVAAAGLENRVDLRLAGIETLREEGVFDLAWIPGPFLPKDVLPSAIDVTLRALKPGGWAILGLYAGPDDPLASKLVELRVVRSGGYVMVPDDAAWALKQHGFSDVSVLPREWQAPMLFVVGRKAP